MSDLRARWRRSFFGVFWSMLQPLGMTALLSVVLSRLFNSDISMYAPYILSGVIVWEYVVVCCTGGAVSFLQADAYIKQCRLPLAVYTIRTVIAAILVLMLASVPLVGWVLVVMPENFNTSWLSLLLFYPLLVALAWPLATILGYIGARFRDLPHAMSLILQALWFVSPVYFEEKMFRQGQMDALIDYNPVYHTLQLVRAPLLQGVWPTPENYLFVIGTAAVLSAVAIAIGLKAEKKVIFYL